MKRPAPQTKPTDQSKTAVALIPPDIAEILGEGPIVEPQLKPIYDRMLAALVTEFEPKSMLEWLAVKELADLSWEIQQLSRFRATCYMAAMKQESENDKYRMSERLPRNEAQQMGAAIDRSIGTVVRLSQMQDSFARRRDGLLRNFEERRARLRQAEAARPDAEIVDI